MDITNRFLKAKHWQLFLLIFGVPIFLPFITMLLIMLVGKYVIMFQLLLLFISIASFLTWFWSIAIGLQKSIPQNIKMKVKKFKRLFFISIIYIIFMKVFIRITVRGSNGNILNVLIENLFAISINLFLLFSIVYLLYFTAKTFKTVELQREVKFSDFVGEFFLILFYPIGIWALQPKINKMIKK